MDPIRVCSTGIVGEELQQVQKALRYANARFDSTISSKTAVLIAKTIHSQKYDFALQHNIPVVRVDWAHDGCCLAEVPQYGINPILGSQIVTSGISKDAQKTIERVCAEHGAMFTTSLSRQAHMLVVPSEGSAGKDKLQFAVKNKISIATVAQFYQLLGKRAPEASLGQPAPALIWFSFGPLQHEYVQVLRCLGMKQASTMDEKVTHVIVGNTLNDDLFCAWRWKAKVVALDWVPACARARKLLPQGEYGVSLPLMPTVTLSSISCEKQRKILAAAVGSLGGRVQEDLIVSSKARFQATCTTHLVLPQSMAASSKKVEALNSRPNGACFAVDVAWIERCAATGRWIPCAPFQLLKEGRVSAGAANEQCDHLDAATPDEGEQRESMGTQTPSLDALIGDIGNSTSQPFMPPPAACPVMQGELALPPTMTGVGNFKGEPAALPVDSQIVVYSCVEGLSKTTSMMEARGSRASGDTTVRLLLSKQVRDALSAEVLESLSRSPAIQVVETVRECTHFVVVRPGKTQTFLSSVAAGKWIVSIGFIDAVLANPAVPSENYELSPTGTEGSDVESLVKACSYQRSRQGNTFASWRVVLVCAEDKQEPFRQILECGGCQSVWARHSSSFLQLNAPLPVGATHVLCEELPHALHAAIMEHVSASERVIVDKLDYLVQALYPV